METLKSPCCNEELHQMPDNIHFHYFCSKCDKEYELDGKTEY